MKKSMKKIVISAALAAAVLAAMTGCGSAEKQPEKAVGGQQTTAAAELPTEDFSRLPEDGEESLNYLSDAIDVTFPDVKGRKMYGFKGVEKVAAGNAEQECYIFDFYTYLTNTDEYTKIATVAQVPDTAELYVLDEQTGKHSEPQPSNVG